VKESQPVAYAEVKEGSYTDNRSGERFEAMSGTPTTETLYVNAGGSAVILKVKYGTYNVSNLGKHYYGSGTSDCCGSSNCSSCTDADGDHDCDCGSFSGSTYVTALWEVEIPTIESVTVLTPDRAILDQIDIFKNGQETISKNPAYTVGVSPTSTYYIRSFGTSSTSHSYGITSGTATVTNSSDTDTCAASQDKADSAAKAAMATSIGSDSGKVFANADKLEIRIAGEMFTLLPGGHAEAGVTTALTGSAASGYSSGTKTLTIAYPAPYASVSDASTLYDELYATWGPSDQIKVIGYNGHPDAGGGRITDGTIFYRNSIEPVLHQVNGLYTFHSNAGDQDMVYVQRPGTIGRTPWNFADITVDLEYSVAPATGTASSSTRAYRGPNPIVFHDPVSAQNVWVYDTPNSVLQDQRILDSTDEIITHPNVNNPNAPSRLYVDFDFDILFDNQGSFGTAFDGTTADSSRGLLNVASGRGPGFSGNFMDKLSLQPRSNNPAARIAATGNTFMDVSSWVNAKYVRFHDVNVRYVMPSNGSGTHTVVGLGEYFSAGQWIKLYHDGGEAKAGDPTTFRFHVVSNTKDASNITFDYLVEAINAPASIMGNPDLLLADSQSFPANADRSNAGYRSTSGVAVERSARSSAWNTTRSDVIGRIGNVIVDDTGDPAWADTFWKPSTTKWYIKDLLRAPDLTQVVSKYLSGYFGMFEETNYANGTFNDRWGSLSQWHSSFGRIGALPLVPSYNALAGYRKSAVKMGYSVQFSVQTLGDYDSEMVVIPSYQLAGDFPAAILGDVVDGKASGGSGFKFFASNISGPGSSSTKQEIWSTVGAVNPFTYNPPATSAQAHTLADPRAKINTAEKSTEAYKQARTTQKIVIGSAVSMVIPQTLRTHIGSNVTSGNVGTVSAGSNALAYGTRAGAASFSLSDSDSTYSNAQRWHGRFSLPSSTVIYPGITMPTTPMPESQLFVKKKPGQYILVYFTARTRRAGAPWDLTTRTNVAGSGLTSDGDPIYPTVPIRDSVTVGSASSGDDPYNRPRTPVVVFDYGLDSSTDVAAEGTH
jgi:hypothetical protein